MRGTSLKLLATGLLASGLFACTTPNTPNATTFPVSANASPGTTPANPNDAGRLFAKACLTTLPDFANVDAALTGEPFTKHATFGTFYHNIQNLSIKVVPAPDGGYCSIVFVSSLSEDDALVAFAAGTQSIAPGVKATVDLGPNRRGPNGLTYYNARTDAQ